MVEEIIELINQAKVISFDIFDTLIIRLYSKPTDLFRHLEESNDVKGFYNARIDGERLAREKANQKGISEVTLDQIYDEMHDSYLNLKNKEIKLEEFVCRQNPEMKSIYDYCIKMNKRVIITSDMYLPIEVIKTILVNAGYDDYEALFLSSDRLKQKASGELYQDVLDDIKVSAKDVLHIGDNQYGDYKKALESGLSAYLYSSKDKLYNDVDHSMFFSVLNQYSDESVMPSILQGLIFWRGISNNEKSYWSEFGYKYAGLLAYGYARWLKEQFDKEGITKAYFMLRDGYIFKRVFDALYPEFETHEIYGSRTMFMLPCAKSYKDIKTFITEEHTQGLTYRRCYERLAINNQAFFNLYETQFGDLDKVVSQEELKLIDKFFIENEALIIDEAVKERKATIEYFDSIGLLNDKSAVVDLGWKGSMLKGIEKICELENRKSNLWGYYVGTHHFEAKGIRALGFALNNGKPDKVFPNKALLDYGYTIAILELMFSAPHPSVLKVQKKDNEFYPIYQEVCPSEQDRMNISGEILSGVEAFVKDIEQVNQKFPLKITSKISIIPLEYFTRGVSKIDEMMIAQIKYFPSVGNDGAKFPISRNGVVTFGVILTWPDSMSAEAEVVRRLKRTAQNLGMKCVPIDNFGHILDENHNVIDTHLFIENPDFVIVTHYESTKMLDAFHYHTLWNPPEIPLNVDYYNDRITANYIMCDDFLIYDKGGMSNHLRTMLLNSPRNVDHALPFMASFPESAMMKPNLEDPKIFYCGMNWEKVVNGGSRHNGLFKLLDDAEAIRIYGPDVVPEWGGIRPWEEYKCYQHPIPFDGFSLLNELNKCGVCLVVSSDIHRRAGAVTNRAFEACAAGAVMISDNNPLMKEMFGDAALFINYNKNNPKDTYNQIMEKYNWIIQNPEKALKLAERAQEIFRKKYSMDFYLSNLANNHMSRFNSIATDLYAKDDTQIVLATYVCNTLSVDEATKLISKVIKNINNQYYNRIMLSVAIDERIAGQVKSVFYKEATMIQFYSLPLFDLYGIRALTDGQALIELRSKTPHDYYVNTNSDEVWFSDHITTMIRAIEDNEAEGAYSGQLFLDCNGYKTIKRFGNITQKTMMNYFSENDDIRLFESYFIYPGAFMFKNTAHEFFPDYALGCFDGSEHVAYLHLLKGKCQKKVVFTKRVTFQYSDDYSDIRNTVVPKEHEKKLISDFTKYDMEYSGVAGFSGKDLENMTPESGMKKHDVLEVISNLPLKPYIKLRYYRIRLRKVNLSSTKGQKLADKYEKALSEYRRLSGL